MTIESPARAGLSAFPRLRARRDGSLRFPMRTQVLDGRQAIDRLAPSWHDLAQADPAASAFHLPEYAQAWLEEFADGREVHAIVASDGDRIAGVAATSLDPDGTLRFLGDLETTDYLGPVAHPDDREPVAQATIEGGLQIPGWLVWEMHGLAADSGWVEPLARAAKAAGLQVEERQQDACPRVALTGTYDEYLQALPSKLRHEIRRKERRLEREVGAYVVRLSTAATLDADLDAFFAMHRSSDGPKGHFLHEGMASFFTAFARALLAAGSLRLLMLEIEGAPVAGIFCYTHGSTWGVYNSAYDHARRSLSPGMVLMAEAIRIAAGEGCRTFDLLRGTEEYKYRFGAVDVPLIQLTLRRG